VARRIPKKIGKSEHRRGYPSVVGAESFFAKFQGFARSGDAKQILSLKSEFSSFERQSINFPEDFIVRRSDSRCKN
jgi:hypothetical protein